MRDIVTPVRRWQRALAVAAYVCRKAQVHVRGLIGGAGDLQRACAVNRVYAASREERSVLPMPDRYSNPVTCVRSR